MSKIKFRSYNRVKFQSEKLKKTVFCQSLLLRDCLLHLEWDEMVQSYEIKPFKISFKLDGTQKTVRPHLLVNYSNQSSTVIWLKSIVDNKNDHERTVKIISNLLELNGFSFVVKTCDEIRQEPLLTNLKLLRKYIRSEISFAHSLSYNDFFDVYSSPTLGDLVQFFVDNNINPQAAFTLLARKVIVADIHNTHLTYSSPILPGQQSLNFENGGLAI